MIVRQAGPLWIHGLVLAAVLDTPAAAAAAAATAASAAGAAPVLDEDGGDTAEVAWDAAAAATRYAALAQRVRDLGLVGVWDLRPLLDVRHFVPDGVRLTWYSRTSPVRYTWLYNGQGKEVATRLNVKQGPQIGRILALLLEWQLEHPEATAEAARAVLPELAAAVDSASAS